MCTITYKLVTQILVAQRSHIIPFPPSLSKLHHFDHLPLNLFCCTPPPPFIMAKGKRGLKFSVAEMESLLDIIDDIVPIGNPEWERV